MASSRHLVLVCCHATFKGGSPFDEAAWILQPFQASDAHIGKLGEHLTFIQHIEAGMAILRQDPESLLVFSGGRTQSLVGATEAESYIEALRILKPDDRIQTLIARIEAETAATDSYQNLLFSIIRFRKITLSYPDKITVITHAFKEQRFLRLHTPALKIPLTQIRVLGINPPFTLAELEATQNGERERGYGLFAKDLYGVREPLLNKRIARNWEAELIKTLGSGLETEVKMLLQWTGGTDGTKIFDEKLPWELN